MTFAEVGVNDLGDWLRAGGILGILALVVKFYLENRKLRLQEKGDDREGWGALIAALTKDVHTVRDEHQECQRRLTEVEAQLRGVHRQLVMQSSNAAISLGQPSADVTNAAERAKRIAEESG